MWHVTLNSHENSEHKRTKQLQWIEDQNLITDNQCVRPSSGKNVHLLPKQKTVRMHHHRGHTHTQRLQNVLYQTSCAILLFPNISKYLMSLYTTVLLILGDSASEMVGVAA